MLAIDQRVGVYASVIGWAVVTSTLILLASHVRAADEMVRIQIGGEPSTLEPWRAIDQYGFSILRNVTEGLYTQDPRGEVSLGLAQSVHSSKDGLEHRFRLKKDAQWSDGKPVTIDDFVFGMRHGLSPKTASPQAEYLYAIKNARAVARKEKPLEELGITRENDELVIRLERPDPSLSMALTMPIMSPLREDVFKANRGRWNTNFPVTGDYLIKKYRPSDSIELVPNPQRKNPGALPVKIQILQEEVTALNLLESGRLDVVTTVTSTEIERLKSKNLIRSFPSTTVFYIAFDFGQAPFKDPSWRKAFASSIDRKGLSRVLRHGFETTTTYLPKAIQGNEELSPVDDAEAVAQIRSLKTKPKIRLAFGSSAFTKIVGEKIQHDVEKKLGIRIELEPMELKSLLSRLRTAPPEMHLLGRSALYNDPMHHLNTFSSIAALSYARFNDPSYEKILEKVRALAPGPERLKAVQSANRLLVLEQTALIPVALRLQIFAVNPHLKGFDVSPFQAIKFSSLRK